MVTKPENITDEVVPELIKRYRGGNQQAFEVLAAACSKPVWLFIRARIGGTDAEDVFQEYLLTLAKHLRKRNDPIETVTHLQRLAFRMGKNHIAEFYRRGQGKHHTEPLQDHDRLDPADNPEEQMIVAVVPALVRRLLLRTNLTDAQRDAVVSVYLLDQTKRKAAADLGISDRALRERLDGAFKKFRDYLEKEKEE